MTQAAQAADQANDQGQSDAPTTAEDRETRRAVGDAGQIVRAAGVVAGIIVVGIAIFSFAPGGPGFLGLGTGVLVGLGGWAVGAFFGLLFGIPKLLDQPKNANAADGAVTLESAYRANTNLTEISDWLTKIIVGVSLIQLGSIREQLAVLVNAIAPGFGTSPAAIPFAAGLLAVTGVAGFMTGYLLARIYLPRAFNEADVIERATSVAVQAAKEQRTESNNADADAIRLVDQALSASSNVQAPTAEALSEALAKASPATVAALASRTADMRSRTWEKEPATMALTIPVLRALIKLNDKDHYLHGQLGFALKDAPDPDYSGSIAELTRAIELRGDPKEAGWLFYEWNRALARARQEKSKDTASDATTKQQIVDDLAVSFLSPDLRRISTKDPDLSTWAARNRVNLSRMKARS
jgi:hypothetical protein